MKTRSIGGKLTSLWHKLTKGSINRQIFGAALTVGLLTVLVKIITVSKELLVAWRFGTGDELDAFLIAMVVPSFTISVIAESFKSALIPTYIAVLEQQGKQAAQKLLSGSLVIALAVLIVTTLIVVLTAPWYLTVIASGFHPEKLKLTISLIGSVAPLIILFGLISLFGAVINSGERFALVALSPVLSPVAIVLFLFIFPNWGIFALAAGLISGSCLELAILCISLIRQKIQLIPSWSGFDRNLRQVAHQYIPVVTGSFLMCSTLIVDRSMAAMLSSGSVASLDYANRLIALPLTLTSLALSTAVIPYFSKTIAQKDWHQVNRTFRFYLRQIFSASIPLTIIIILASKILVKVLFERGAFDATDTEIVSQIQICYALQIPFYIATIFVVRLINSWKYNYILAWGSGISLILNIIGNYLFLQIMGIKGIALSTSVVYLFSFVFLYSFVNKHLKNKVELNNEQ